MCDFISWVEIKRKGKLVLCYLTDEDVFSKYGREIFVDSRDNDVLGHGAIRKYFKLGCEGLDKEVRDFWNNEKLPPELLEKTSSPNMFDKHWGRMWREKFFQNDDLTYLVKYAPEEWKVRAWEQLIKQNPSNDDLTCLVAYAPEEWKVRACEQLLKQNDCHGELVEPLLILGLLLGFVALGASHGFSPYLNHPLGIGYLIIFSLMLGKYNSKLTI